MIAEEALKKVGGLMKKTEKLDILTEGIGANEEVAVWKPGNLNAETPALVALHGNWATWQRNKNYGWFFAERGFLVIAPTLRHHKSGNESSRELGKTSVLDYASDVLYLLKILREGKLVSGFRPARPPVLMGHSMGGLVAQVVAARTNLSGLILLCSAPSAGIGLHTDKDYAKRIARVAWRIFSGKPYLPDRESLYLYVYNGMPENEHPTLYERAVHESGRSSREILAGSGTGIAKTIAGLLSRSITVDESHVLCPILIIGCENDRIVPPNVARDMYYKYQLAQKGAEIEILEGFAHWPQYEPGWEESARFILEWLKKTVL